MNAVDLWKDQAESIRGNHVLNPNGQSFIPSSIIVQYLTFSFYNKNEIMLADWDEPDNVEVYYPENTTSSFEITDSQLKINFSKPIFIDTTGGFLVKDYYLNYVIHNFQSTTTTWNYTLADGWGWGDDVEKGVNKQFSAMLGNIKKGTKLNTKNYKPFSDPDLIETTTKVLTNFLQSSNEDPNTPEDEKNKAPDVDIKQFTDLRFTSAFYFKDDFFYFQNNNITSKNYVKIGKGASISSELRIQNNLEDLSNFFGTPEEKKGVDLKINFLKIHFGNLEIFYDGEKIMQIHEVVINYGGGVTVSSYELFGIAKSAGETEILIRTVILLLAYRKAVQQNPYNALGFVKAQTPKAKLLNEFIQNSMNNMIKESLSEFITKNSAIFPDFDLKKFLGWPG